MKHEISIAKLSRHLELATEEATALARSMVHQPLPRESRFLLRSNQSFDGNPLEDDEEVYPGESPSGPLELTLEELAAWLWRDGKVPEWVNIRAYDATDEFTLILVEVCGRFTALKKHLYHVAEGYPPFHATSPTLPSFDWESVEENGRFDLEGRRSKG